jgi:tetratricopeptide (TPR) repeat protein
VSSLKPRIVAALVLGLLLSAGELRADRWYVHYENAERALAAEKWREAVSELLQAIERKGDSGTRVRSYGMKVVDYFPYLKLGIAYHHLGQEPAALEAFETEERLGVVQGSPEARRELERYRQLATDAQRQATADTATTARRRVDEIIQKSLTEARRLEGQGRLQEAMNALAPGLAADPEHAESVQLMASLRARVVAEEQRQREAEGLRKSLETAKDHLARGEAEPAASLLRQILAAGPNDEAARLLERAQAVIVASVAAQPGDNRLSREIAEALTAAGTLEKAGKPAEALERLELVLALEPGHGPARTMRERLLAAQEISRQDLLIQDTLRAAGAHVAAGRFEDALSAANKVLALDRKNPAALGVVRQAYAQISRRLLEIPGTKTAQNIPPAIRFADLRQDVHGERVEIVEGPEFRLQGMAIDSSPVTIELLAEGRPVEATSTSQAVGEYFISEFSARHHLGSGATALTVVATDSAGLSSRSEYMVLYAPPWFRAPWFFAASGGSLGLGAAGLLVYRRRKQRKRLARKFNPFIAGGPIFDEKLFYGREPLIQKILQTVHNNSLLLHGERRIGKTSLLHQVQRRLEALEDPLYEFHPVYIDLQGAPEEKFFAILADQIFEALQPVAGPADREPALARAAYGQHDLVRELHGLLRQLKERSPKQVKLVLLIDEVDELNGYDPRVSQSLRSLFMKRFAENLAAVVAGVRIRKEWEKESSPWYNFFEEIEVGAIATDQAQRLVVEPLRGTFRFEAGTAERIVLISGGKPFQIQRRCLALVQRLHEEGRRTITRADVDALEAQEASVS